MAKKTSTKLSRVKSSSKLTRSLGPLAKGTSAKVASVKGSAKVVGENALGLPLTSWTSQLRRAKGAEVRSGRRAFLYAFGAGTTTKQIKSIFSGRLHKWQLDSLLNSESDSVFFQGAEGATWIIRAQAPTANGPLERTSYARFRDMAGTVVGQLGAFRPEKLILDLIGLTDAEERGVIVGLEVATYSFQENRVEGAKTRREWPQLLLREGQLAAQTHREASELGVAMNLARHYVNLPPSDLHPRAYAESAKAIFANSATVDVEIWEGKKLEAEKMGLLLAVGAAASEGPRLVHLRYRPKTVSASARPIAIVGKGITFDSGGLDIKPASGMRLMKKDMGGSAAAIAVLKWAERTELPLPLDVYLSIAENAVGSRAFRPGDVIRARSGLTIEISNTDAEGRLVLADALDLAVRQSGDDQPSHVINLATLTGAIKVGLGGEIAGLFTNNDGLAEVLSQAGLETGDLMWRMPLHQPYRSQLKSTFADLQNSAEGGFGGAITAALFLESFVRNVPWAHLDIYAWRDSAGGAWTEAGGNGQPVQALTAALTRLARLASEAGAEELA